MVFDLTDSVLVCFFWTSLLQKGFQMKKATVSALWEVFFLTLVFIFGSFYNSASPNSQGGHMFFFLAFVSVAFIRAILIKINQDDLYRDKKYLEICRLMGAGRLLPEYDFREVPLLLDKAEATALQDFLNLKSSDGFCLRLFSKHAPNGILLYWTNKRFCLMGQYDPTSGDARILPLTSKQIGDFLIFFQDKQEEVYDLSGFGKVKELVTLNLLPEDPKEDEELPEEESEGGEAPTVPTVSTESTAEPPATDPKPAA